MKGLVLTLIAILTLAMLASPQQAVAGPFRCGPNGCSAGAGGGYSGPGYRLGGAAVRAGGTVVRFTGRVIGVERRQARRAARHGG